MDVLSAGELELRDKLEHQVKTGFVMRGQALRSIKRLKLYRDLYDDFAEYCQNRFGFTMLYIDRCMVAAETYYAIEDYLETRSLKEPLPTKQAQLRPIFQAHLTPIEAGEVWVMAVKLALGSIPSKPLVQQAVKTYLNRKYPTVNPFYDGQICRIKG